MRLRNIPGSREVIGESEFVVHSPETSAGKWAEIFGILSVSKSVWEKEDL